MCAALFFTDFLSESINEKWDIHITRIHLIRAASELVAVRRSKYNFFVYFWYMQPVPNGEYEFIVKGWLLLSSVRWTNLCMVGCSMCIELHQS